MTFTVGGRGGHLQVLLLVAALRNAGAQGLAEVEAEAGSGRKRVAGRRVLPRQQQQAAAAPADVQQAAAVHGAARFWRGFGGRTALVVWSGRTARGELGAALSLLYTKNLMGHLTSPLPAEAHNSNSPQKKPQV